jgi:hypothetical protein
MKELKRKEKGKNKFKEMKRNEWKKKRLKELKRKSWQTTGRLGKQYFSFKKKENYVFQVKKGRKELLY